ncbi:hypothetical protein Q5752_001918 [Cryptotrichosporon argae]
MTASDPALQAGPSDAAAAAAVFRRLHPDQYLSRFLARGYRPDGRKLAASRAASVNAGSIATADGSALVRLGDTTVVCGIKAEVAEPDSARPNEGFIVPNIDLPALCSPKFKPGPPGDEAQTLSSWLYELLISSQTVPLDSLCISPGRAAWALYIDVVCINYDGNAFDAAVLAAMAALRDTRLPRANVDDDGQVVCTAKRHPLKLGPMPLTASFGIFTNQLLPDPTAFETPLLRTRITLALDPATKEGRLVKHAGLASVAGGAAAKGASGVEVLRQAWKLSEARVDELARLL